MKNRIKNMWEEIYNNRGIIREFLSLQDTKQSLKIQKLLLISLRIVTGELYLYKELYDKYPVTCYTTEDYVDILIENIAKKSTIDSIRENIWGHIKFYHGNIIHLFKKVVGNCDKLDKNDDILLIKCLTVVYSESILRKREEQFKNDKKRSVKS